MGLPKFGRDRHSIGLPAASFQKAFAQAPSSEKASSATDQELEFRRAMRRTLMSDPSEVPKPDETAIKISPQHTLPPLREIEAHAIATALREKRIEPSLQPYFAIDDQGARALIPLKIVGKLDLKLLQDDRPIFLWDCEFTDEIDLTDAQVRILSLAGSKIAKLSLFDFHASGDLDLTDCIIGKNLFAMDAYVGGSVVGTNLKILNEESGNAVALSLHRAHVGASVLMAKSTIHGIVDLTAVRVDGQINFEDATIEGVGGSAIRASRATANAILLCGNFNATGTVDLSDVTVDSHLNCWMGSFNGGDGGVSLHCDSIRIGSDAMMMGVKSAGRIDFGRAIIGGILNCSGAHFTGRYGKAFNGDQMRVRGNVFLRGDFKSKGEIDFWGASIDGSVMCYGGKFENDGAVALRFRSANVGSGLFFILPPDAGAMDVERSQLPGHAEIVGDVVLVGASIHELAIPSPNGLANGHYLLDGLTYDRINTVGPDYAAAYLAWLNRQPPQDLKRSFKAQPWSQLATVLRSSGYSREARQIAIVCEKKRTKSLGLWPRLWSYFLRATVLYGYSPWRPALWSALFIAIGWLTIDAAAYFGYMAPRDGNVLVSERWRLEHKLPRDYPEFNSFIYALDVYLPVSGLDQRQIWQPTKMPVQFGDRATDGKRINSDTLLARVGLYDNQEADKWIEARLADGWHRRLMWTLMLLGWLFTSVFIAGITGIVKRE